MQLYVLSLVDHTHPSAAQLLDDAVVRNGLADHWRQILRRRNGQVNESLGVGRASTDGWRKIPTALKMPMAGVLSDNACNY
jgi:hypothetical protein